MDWRLLLDYIRVLIWPVIVGTLGIVFRKQLASILKNIQSIETPIGTLAFQNQADAIEREASAIEAEIAADIGGAGGAQTPDAPLGSDGAENPPPGRQEDRALILEKLMPLARTDPTAAVLAAWREIEHTLKNAAATSGRRRQTVPYLLAQAVEEDLLPPALAQLTLDLRQLRNRVVHDERSPLAPGGATSYVLAAERVIETLHLATTPTARHARYEQDVHDALSRLGFTVRKALGDSSYDFLVGDQNTMVGVEAKHRSRLFSAADLDKEKKRNAVESALPALVVTNAPLADTVARFNGTEAEKTGTRLREVVQWKGPQDDDILVRALVRSGAVLF
ncbi:hypothetical protein GCM10018793_48590 [Streptomyces sulfonofaciens]|uniref:Restriction endonuclease n=1 Tax=Streptomyces sulfonofaciens TaxID=68272 RepID=A0A919GH22_9ACTN|nr:hypothetical protein [Streptomyces sulfonofaciens]GHH84379.1 hypothetical protein GCM10018793_48590 [Streptomyces sulfonofaciens]